MKKMIMPLMLVALVLGSCGEKSKKGAWIAEDKDNYTSECKKAAEGESIPGMDADTYKKFVDQVCSCSLEKLEDGYENAIEANKDREGVTKIGEQCGMEAAMSLMGEMDMGGAMEEAPVMDEAAVEEVATEEGAE